MIFFLLHGEKTSPNKGINGPDENKSQIQSVYEQFPDEGLNFDAFSLAFTGFTKIRSSGTLSNDSLLTLIDYSKPSSEERLYVLDLKNRLILEKSLVAHGKQSGLNLPEFFSNVRQSHKSSLGFFLTENTYFGKHGYSLRLNGIEKGINDNAKNRAIVFHGAKYVSREYIKTYGRIGRSFGCPALPPEKNDKIIDLIKEQSCVFIYHPSARYLNESSFFKPGPSF
jgi:hypothetical protein